MGAGLAGYPAQYWSSSFLIIASRGLYCIVSWRTVALQFDANTRPVSRIAVGNVLFNGLMPDCMAIRRILGFVTRHYLQGQWSQVGTLGVYCTQ